jgi:hypothetical protein
MRCVLLPFPHTTSYREEPQQDAEKDRQRRSRIAQRFNVWPGQTPVHTGDGWMGGRVKTVYDSPLGSLRPCWTAFLRILPGCSESSHTSTSVTATEVEMGFSSACFSCPKAEDCGDY